MVRGSRIDATAMYAWLVHVGSTSNQRDATIRTTSPNGTL